LTDEEAFELIFACNKIHTKEQLKALQSLTLDQKIQATKVRIGEWYNYYDGKVYVSFSGGKDSTVLLDIARQVHPDIEAVYVDTGLEYPETRDFVKTKNNVTWLHPVKYNRHTKQYERYSFKQVLEDYGYPVISKEVSNAIAGAKEGNMRWKRLNGELINPKTGELSQFNCPQYKYLLDAPFKISDKCCDVMKKRPAYVYDKQSGKKPMLATMTDESRQRKKNWMHFGCNAFDKNHPSSQPMSFWTEQDVLQYIKRFGIPYASIYGDIIEDENGELITTKEHRTGCMFCMFGAQCEKNPNRFQRMKITHPKQYDYCINKLGIGEILDFIGVKY
jgi:3'-phosphoadenosine 5'-phosphosulfate sulfotransferase (PAPS reductase)/FAD synthetase